MRQVARVGGVDPEFIRDSIAKGLVVLPTNTNHKIKRLSAIGKGLRTKVNANIGTSPDHADLQEELNKLRVAVEAGADTIMDLSIGEDLDQIRRAILKRADLPLGTVPIYQAALQAARTKKSIVNMTKDDILSVIERQAEDGVDFITVHCGLNRRALESLREQGRITDVVSRGGAFLVTWMIANNKENPLYEEYDKILEIANKYDVTLSLGDGLRPGCLADATDRPQVQELICLGELRDRAYNAGVQVMIEGPGHIPLDEIEANVLLAKKLCREAPFYVLGPLVTDVAPGYDHITGAIGGAIAAMAGADFLCYVTPSEHLRLPTVQDVKEGVVATRIAAHAADIVKGVAGALRWDERMARARKALKWKEMINLALDSQKAREYHSSFEGVCTMCGEYCAIKLAKEYFKR
jgi:phosphomethylpyrimidine synthase